MPASIRTRPDQPPVATQSLGRRLTDAVLGLVAGAALLTAFAPLPWLALNLTAWAVFILVLALSALLDHRRAHLTKQSPTALGITPMADDQDIDDWLGPFNPDNGLSLDMAPYFIYDDLGRDS
ncbi:MAG: hypothetical protein VBE63_29900 [Lamprobacter sp.]|uniref:hypothetical protein n=1 Tax=Lamprobacter sp. TaxID=3100796 RepID=UPI002B262904|nr:hypothetical protein [Lamprobacter sp.]MEA3644104.1 hypothetical protein [Lamprobacter sp.]